VFGILNDQATDRLKHACSTCVAEGTSEFDSSEPFVFRHGSPVALGVAKMLAASKESIAQEEKGVDAKMKANDKLHGAMIRLNCDYTGFAPKLGTSDLAPDIEKGFSPWLDTVRDGAFRWTQGKNPMGGAACLLTASDVDASFCVLMPVQPIISSGFVLNDLESHLQTNTGKSSHKHVKVVKLSGGDCMYSPYGTIAVPLFISVETLNLDKKPRGFVKKHAHFVHIPLVSKKLAVELELNVWTAVKNFNMDHYEMKQGDRLWKPRFKSFGDFVAAVDAEREKK
jgi:hypothetical protein